MQALKSYETIIGSISMMLLLFLSGYFYLEKMTQMDSAFATIAIVNKAGFVVPHYRFPIVFTQVLPVLLIWLSAPLKWVIFSYSVNFYVLYAVCFGVAVFHFKQPLIAILIPMVCVLNSAEVFFIQTEILHGLVFAVLFLAWLECNYQKDIHSKERVTGFLIMSTAILFHPIANILVLFVLVFFLIRKNHKPTASHYSIGAVAVLWLLLKAYLMPDNGYEDQFYNQQQTLTDTLSAPLQSYVMKFYGVHSTDLYVLTNILFALALVVYGVLKQWLLLLLTLFSAVGYLLLMAVLFKGDSNVMMERVFLGLALIVAVFFSDCLCRVKIPQWGKALLWMCVFTTGFSNILQAANRQTNHLNLSKDVAAKLQQQSGHKFYTTEADIPYAHEYVMWPLACEQLMLSAIYYPKSVKTIYMFTDTKEAREILSEKMTDRTILVASFYLKIQDSIFNQSYFALPAEPYQYLKLYP